MIMTPVGKEKRERKRFPSSSHSPIPIGVSVTVSGVTVVVAASPVSQMSNAKERGEKTKWFPWFALMAKGLEIRICFSFLSLFLFRLIFFLVTASGSVFLFHTHTPRHRLCSICCCRPDMEDGFDAADGLEKACLPVSRRRRRFGPSRLSHFKVRAVKSVAARKRIAGGHTHGCLHPLRAM